MSKKIKFDKNFNVRGGEEISHILFALLFRTDFRYNKNDKKITNEFSSSIFGFCYLLYKRVTDFSFVLDDNTEDIEIIEDVLK